MSTDDNHRALQISFIACTAETARPARSFGVAGASSPLQQGGGVQQHFRAIDLNGVVAQPGHITGERIGTVGIDGDPLCLCGFESSGDIARTS